MLSSLIIATYNRPLLVSRLLKEIDLCQNKPSQIIIVDSSDESNEDLLSNHQITYVRSSHKNQPYQRYLGSQLAKHDWVIFLDDDLEILDFSFFLDLSNAVTNLEIEGISVGIDYKSSIDNSIKAEYSPTSWLFRIINYLSGVPLRKAGKIYMAGLSGPLPHLEGPVQYFNGPVMVFKRSVLADCFDSVLFSLFERRLAMGEDKVISMRLGLKNKLWYLPKKYFRHPAVASHYFTNIRSFQAKVSYSRLYLSLVYSRVNDKNPTLAYSHYYYYICWRIFISALRILIKPSSQNIQLFRGHMDGLILTFTDKFKVQSLTPGIDWQRELRNDINRVKQ